MENEIDVGLIRLIREKDKEYLSNSVKVESGLLTSLGLNNEFIHEYPSSLHGFCGVGLRSWQYPNQFSKYLVHLSKYKIESYMEVGVRHGGTFIITTEYLNKFHPIKKALAVDINPCPAVNQYRDKYNKSAEFWKINSQSFKFEGFCNHCNGIDLVMIDADHADLCIRKDFANVQKMAKIIALHDISNDACSAVSKLWKELKKDTNRYEVFEFVDQYPCFKGKNYFGTGVLVSKL